MEKRLPTTLQTLMISAPLKVTKIFQIIENIGGKFDRLTRLNLQI